MTRQRITDPERRLIGFVEEAHTERKLVLFDAMCRRVGSFSIDTGITASEDGRVVAFGNRLLRLLPDDCERVLIEPEPNACPMNDEFLKAQVISAIGAYNSAQRSTVGHIDYAFPQNLRVVDENTVVLSTAREVVLISRRFAGSFTVTGRQRRM